MKTVPHPWGMTKFCGPPVKSKVIVPGSQGEVHTPLWHWLSWPHAVPSRVNDEVVWPWLAALPPNSRFDGDLSALAREISGHEHDDGADEIGLEGSSNSSNGRQQQENGRTRGQGVQLHLGASKMLLPAGRRKRRRVASEMLRRWRRSRACRAQV